MNQGDKETHRTKGRYIIFLTIMVVAVCATALIITEVAVHIWYAKQDEEPHSPVKFADRFGFYVYPPLKTVYFTNDEGKRITIRTDGLGLRNGEGALKNAKVIVTGDSFIMGINTPEEQTLVGRLRSRGIPAYNAGVDGLSTIQEYFLLNDLLEVQNAKPDIIIVGFYLGNDLRDNFCHMNPDCNDLGAAAGGIDAAATIMRSFTLSEMESYKPLYSGPMYTAAEKTNAAIAEVARMAAAHKIRLVILGIPSRAQALESLYDIANFNSDKLARRFAMNLIKSPFSFDRPDRFVAGFARRHNIAYLSLLDEFRRRGAAAMYCKIDHHWNAAGQEAAAEMLVKEVFQRPGYTETRNGGSAEKSGASKK